MRKLLSILLLAAAGLPLWAPLLALAQGPEAATPACCRRDGAHHCSMSSMAPTQTAAEQQAPQWRSPQERCPYCPGSVAATHYHEVGSTARAEAVFAGGFAHPLGRAQTESKRRISQDRSRQKRGPPHTLRA